MNFLSLTGRSDEDLVEYENHKLKPQALDSFLKLKEYALACGYKLEIISSFRSFDHQLKIFNNKFLGIRKIYDDNDQIVEVKDLSPKEIIEKILRFSALPGTSRHHWGTDIDVFDSLSQQKSDVKLTPSECEKGGPQERVHLWLDDVLSDKSWEFVRPYAIDSGGTSPEKWHLSYAPLSEIYKSQYTFEVYQKNLELMMDQICGYEELSKNASYYYEKYLSLEN